MKNQCPDIQVIRDYVQNLKRLKAFGSSKRLFNLIFDDGLDILRGYGDGITLFGLGDRHFACIYDDDYILKLRYNSGIVHDRLDIITRGGELGELYNLTRQRVFVDLSGQALKFAPKNFQYRMGVVVMQELTVL